MYRKSEDGTVNEKQMKRDIKVIRSLHFLFVDTNMEIYYVRYG
jgi:hypothetical protein